MAASFNRRRGCESQHIALWVFEVGDGEVGSRAGRWTQLGLPSKTFNCLEGSSDVGHGDIEHDSRLEVLAAADSAVDSFIGRNRVDEPVVPGFRHFCRNRSSGVELPVEQFAVEASQARWVSPALGAWGLGVPVPSPHTLSATSVLLFLRGSVQPETNAPTATLRVELDDRVWTVRTAAGQVHVEPGEPDTCDASLTANPLVLNELLQQPAKLEAAMHDGTVVVGGDAATVRRLLDAAASSVPTVDE
jgi:hypothetical protein